LPPASASLERPLPDTGRLGAAPSADEREGGCVVVGRHSRATTSDQGFRLEGVRGATDVYGKVRELVAEFARTNTGATREQVLPTRPLSISPRSATVAANHQGNSDPPGLLGCTAPPRHARNHTHVAERLFRVRVFAGVECAERARRARRGAALLVAQRPADNWYPCAADFM
jgi:hypothetical protein